jgi:predicted nucleic acid-binding protein
LEVAGLMNGWIKVFESTNQIYTELVKNEIASNEINAVVLSKQDSSYLLGYFEIYVPAENAEIARLIAEIFNKNESEEKAE